MRDWKTVPAYGETTVYLDQVKESMWTSAERQMRRAQAAADTAARHYRDAYTELWLAAEERHKTLTELCAARNLLDVVRQEVTE